MSALSMSMSSFPTPERQPCQDGSHRNPENQAAEFVARKYCRAIKTLKRRRDGRVEIVHAERGLNGLRAATAAEKATSKEVTAPTSGDGAKAPEAAVSNSKAKNEKAGIMPAASETVEDGDEDWEMLINPIDDVKYIANGLE